jgi:hypothetical protein
MPSHDGLNGTFHGCRSQPNRINVRADNARNVVEKCSPQKTTRAGGSVVHRPLYVCQVRNRFYGFTGRFSFSK